MADDERQTTPDSHADAARPRRRSAVTIDLEPAKEAAAGAPKGQTEASSDKKSDKEKEAPVGGPPRGAPGTIAAPPPNRGSGWSAIGFALIGAIVVGLAIYLLMFTDLLPAPGSDETDAVRDDVAALETQIAQIQTALSEQGNAANAAIGDVSQTDLDLIEQRLAELEAQIADVAVLETGLAALSETANRLVADLQAEGTARAALVDEVDELRRQSVAVAAAGGDPDAAAALGADINALAERVDGLEDNAGGAAVAALEANATALGARLTALETAVPPEEIVALREELGALTAEVLALAERTDALTETADALEADAGTRGEAALAARSLAIANIRNALDRGESFASELDLLAELGVPAADLEALRAASATGIAGVAALQADFPDVADAILTASTATDEDANFLQRLFDNARNAVVVEPTVPVEGDDAPAIVSRMRAAVEAGDFATALAVREGLSLEGLEASSDWAARLETRVAAETAVTQLERSLAGGVSE